MARVISANTLTQLIDGSLGYFILVETTLNGEVTPRRYTSYNQDITFNSNNYVSDGGLLGLAAPRASTVLDKQTYTLQLADGDQTIQTLLTTTSLVGSPITITMIVVGSNGQPMLNSSDSIIAYKGRVDGTSISFDEQKVIELSCSSPFADFDLVQDRIAQSDFQNQFSTTDTAFDEIFNGASEVDLAWGKA